MQRYSVVNAATGATVLDGVTARQFDAWNDTHQSAWRHVRPNDAVPPSLRAALIERQVLGHQPAGHHYTYLMPA